MKKIILIIIAFTPLLIIAQSRVFYDIHFTVNEDLSLLARVDFHIDNAEADTLSFVLGDQFANEIIKPTLSVQGEEVHYQFITDTNNVSNSILQICIPQKKDWDFSVQYAFYSIESLLFPTETVFYISSPDCPIIPVPLFSCNMSFAPLRITVTDSTVDYVVSREIRTFLDLYLYIYRKDAVGKCSLQIGQTYVDFLLYKDEIKPSDKNVLQHRFGEFMNVANTRLYHNPWTRNHIHVATTPSSWGSTCRSDMICCHTSHFRTTVFYHEFLHFWINETALFEKEEGTTFLTETLTEFLMWQYVRMIDTAKYMELVDFARNALQNNEMKNIPLIKVVEENNSSFLLLMYYGPLQLQNFADAVGTEECLTFLENFINDSHQTRSNYASFKNKLLNSFPREAATQLIDAIENSPKNIHYEKK